MTRKPARASTFQLKSHLKLMNTHWKRTGEWLELIHSKMDYQAICSLMWLIHGVYR